MYVFDRFRGIFVAMTLQIWNYTAGRKKDRKDNKKVFDIKNVDSCNTL